MSNPSSDSYRNPLRHTGQDYSFAPRYLRPRDPFSPTNASRDIKPKENQGYYPLGSLWTNSTNGNLWVLAIITNNLAKWILLTGSESGTFIPELTLSSPGTSSFTYSEQFGSYTKIGNLVTVSIRITLTNFTIGTGSGTVILQVLPFNAATNGNLGFRLSCLLQNITFAPGVSWYVGAIAPGLVNMTFAGSVSNSTAIQIQATDLSNTSNISVTGSYFSV